MEEIPWLGRTMVNMISGENLLVMVLRRGMVSLPMISYLFLL